MALKRLVIDGFGQLELNNVFFRRSGSIEAQCFLDETDFADVPAENGMLLAVDRVNRLVKFPVDDSLPIALNYTTEHVYDERVPGLKDFKFDDSQLIKQANGNPIVYVSRGMKATKPSFCYGSSIVVGGLHFNAEDKLINSFNGMGRNTFSIIINKNTPK